MPLEADTSTESDLPELPDWLKDDDEGTTQATADESVAPEGQQPPDQPDDPFAAAQQRDQAGRFTRSESSPTGFVPQDVRAQAPAATAQTEEEAAAEAEPFTYRADGREYTIPGLRVPESHAEQVRQLLAEGMHHRTTWQAERAATQQREAQVQQWVQSKQAEFQAATGILTELFQNPDKLAEMYADWQTRGPALMERAKAAGLEAELQMYRAQADQGIAEQASQAVEDGLWDSMSELTDSTFPGVFDQYDFTALFGELKQAGAVQVADRDYPEYGYQAGDILADPDVIYGRMAQKASEVIQRDKAARLAADKVAKTASKNAAVMGRGRRPPPTVGARSGGVPAGQQPEIKTSKDWMRALEADDEG